MVNDDEQAMCHRDGGLLIASAVREPVVGREPFEQMALDSGGSVLGGCRMLDETHDLAAYVGHDISPLCSAM